MNSNNFYLILNKIHLVYRMIVKFSKVLFYPEIFQHQSKSGRKFYPSILSFIKMEYSGNPTELTPSTNTMTAANLLFFFQVHIPKLMHLSPTQIIPNNRIILKNISMPPF